MFFFFPSRLKGGRELRIEVHDTSLQFFKAVFHTFRRLIKNPSYVVFFLNNVCLSIAGKILMTQSQFFLSEVYRTVEIDIRAVAFGIGCATLPAVLLTGCVISYFKIRLHYVGLWNIFTLGNLFLNLYKEISNIIYLSLG